MRASQASCRPDRRDGRRSGIPAPGLRTGARRTRTEPGEPLCHREASCLSSSCPRSSCRQSAPSASALCRQPLRTAVQFAINGLRRGRSAASPAVDSSSAASRASRARRLTARRRQRRTADRHGRRLSTGRSDSGTPPPAPRRPPPPADPGHGSRAAITRGDGTPTTCPDGHSPQPSRAAAAHAGNRSGRRRPRHRPVQQRRGNSAPLPVLRPACTTSRDPVSRSHVTVPSVHSGSGGPGPAASPRGRRAAKGRRRRAGEVGEAVGVMSPRPAERGASPGGDDAGGPGQRPASRQRHVVVPQDRRRAATGGRRFRAGRGRAGAASSVVRPLPGAPTRPSTLARLTAKSANSRATAARSTGSAGQPVPRPHPAPRHPDQPAPEPGAGPGKPEPELDPDPDPKPGTRSWTDPGHGHGHGHEAGPELDPDPDPDTKPEPELDPKLDPDRTRTRTRSRDGPGAGPGHGAGSATHPHRRPPSPRAHLLPPPPAGRPAPPRSP